MPVNDEKAPNQARLPKEVVGSGQELEDLTEFFNECAKKSSEGQELDLNNILSVDLSRNAISSLKGIELVPNVQKLSLYFNRIENFTELMRLRACGRLVSLDLRLNPVARLEGYRG